MYDKNINKMSSNGLVGLDGYLWVSSLVGLMTLATIAILMISRRQKAR